MSDSPAVLVLENGHQFWGHAFGACGQTLGELVFSTGMSGYQETLTDPSYHRQILVSTAPQIGNTGWNDHDNESRDGKIWVAGYVIRDLSPRASNWRATTTLPQVLSEHNIVGICDVDTRSIVRHIRQYGAMKAGIFSGDALGSPQELSQRVCNQPGMLGANLTAEVSTTQEYVLTPESEPRWRVVALDLGLKTSITRHLTQRGIQTIVVPSTITFDEIMAHRPHGIFLSNGPGDPATAGALIELTRRILDEKIPLFGICFGNQILGQALGLSTYKLQFGHRGMNIPVIDHHTNRVTITSHNHGFALCQETDPIFQTDFGQAMITHTCANDGVIEGVKLIDGNAFSVQYHPEAAAGPHDGQYLFDQFVALMSGEY